MHRIARMAIIGLATVLSVSVPARAVDLTHSFVLGADVGFDMDPDLLAGAVIGEYMVTSNVGLGPYLTFAGDNNRFYFSTSGMAKYKANLNESVKLKPYGMMGIGFMIKNEKEHHVWDRETQFLFPVGAGFEYWSTDKFAWGANIVFNITDNIFLGAMFGIRTRF